jgi:NAD(P)-dependent dehydrogenase (short-subunit alcohol dehydrogenase family)
MKSVFITGAAAGIGLATARRFAGQGYFVGLYDINQEGLASALASGDFPNACSGLCDVRSRASIEEALAEFAAHTEGKLNILVNNAGVLSAGAFAEITPQAHDLMIDINVKGFTNVAQAGFPYLQDTPGSCLVNLCSASSIHGISNLAVYSASKFYVDGLTQALHLEWNKHDIRVTCVKPDLVDTPMAHDVQAEAASERPIGLQPEDIAAAIDKAVHGHRISYVIGRAASVWALVDRLLPEFLRAAFTKRLLGRN